MALSRLLSGWVLVTVWLLAWDLVATRGAAWDRRAAVLSAGEALLLTLLGGLWFGSLGTGEWWLVFALVGALREWPPPAEPAARARGRATRPAIALRLLRTVRTVVVGGILAWRLGAG
jgi:hypothetical protein